MTRYVIDAPTLLHLVADGEITEQVALQRHERLTELKMRLLGDRVSRRTAWKIAREHGWATTDDAEYIAVCQLQADALVTVDPTMAAMAAGQVELAPLDALFVS
jgi:predicted nucleic acid-binding protein